MHVRVSLSMNVCACVSVCEYIILPNDAVRVKKKWTGEEKKK